MLEASRDNLMKGLGLKRTAYDETPQKTADTLMGYLAKASFGAWNNMSWNQRWFVLNIGQGVLCYYKRKPKEPNDERDQIEKSVQQLYYLRQAGAACTTHYDPNCAPKMPQHKAYYFQVRVVPDLKKWQDTSAILHLCVSNKKHRDQWVAALNAAIDGTHAEGLLADVGPRTRTTDNDDDGMDDSSNDTEGSLPDVPEAPAPAVNPHAAASSPNPPLPSTPNPATLKGNTSPAIRVLPASVGETSGESGAGSPIPPAAKAKALNFTPSPPATTPAAASSPSPLSPMDKATT
eukprot:EG_transcript_22351